MKRFALAPVACGLLAAVASGSSFAQATIKIDGSSTVYPITEAVAEEFQAAKKGAVRVTVGISGTGGGFKKFCRGETDISDASRPIKGSEMEACKAAGIKYIELPVAFDALTVVVNPKNPLNSVSVEDLKKMWEPAAQGKVTGWKQVNAAFPDQPLKLYGPGTDSGTFEYFTEAVNGKACLPATTGLRNDNVCAGRGREWALRLLRLRRYIEQGKRRPGIAPAAGKRGGASEAHDRGTTSPCPPDFISERQGGRTSPNQRVRGVLPEERRLVKE